LNSEPVVGRGQRAGSRVRWPVRFLQFQEGGDGFFESALQQMGVTVKGNQAARVDTGFEWQMEPMDGVEKEQSTDAFV